VTAYAELVKQTPIVAAPKLGPGVTLKLECEQRTGSFKLRGACVRLDALTAEERARGVVTASAGNHGAGVAAASRVLGIRADVVVPRRTPQNKRSRIRDLGASLVVRGETYDESEAIARKLAGERGALFVSPFDDELVIRGNGELLGEEILAQAPDTRVVIAPVGGGGLASGLIRALRPRGVTVIGVQPETNCAMKESQRLGRALTAYEGGHTLAEGCEGAVAERTFAICRDLRIELVSEDAIRRALGWIWNEMGIAAEPTAAVGVAGVLDGAIEPVEGMVVVVSGGNVDPELLASL
jgi:threonine dehydratase